MFDESSEEFEHASRKFLGPGSLEVVQETRGKRVKPCPLGQRRDLPDWKSKSPLQLVRN
ncbi:MAG: hypothetical protein V5A83_05710 [Candidatus Bipolaricaulota bacterium]